MPQTSVWFRIIRIPAKQRGILWGGGSAEWRIHWRGGIATANLFVTQDPTPILNRSLLAGETGDPILRLRLRCTGQENVAVTFLKFTSAGGPANSIDRLFLYKEGETQPFAPATVAACGSDPAPAQDGGTAVRNFCASLTTDIITQQCAQDGYGGLTQALIVRPVIKTLNGGAISGEVVRLFLSENPAHAAVQAHGLTTGGKLNQNDGNTTANGEIFIAPNAGSIPTAMANARITGYPNVVVLSKIITIANGNPAPNGTAIPSGISPFGQFTFTAAANQNGRNVTLLDIIITVNAQDVTLDAASFKFFNKGDINAKVPCRASQPDGTTISGPVTNTFLVDCQNIQAVMNTSITAGGSQSFAIEGNIINNNVSAAPSSLQASLKDFGGAYSADTLPSLSFGAPYKHLRWLDGTTDFFWIEYPETFIKSSLYSFPN